MHKLLYFIGLIQLQVLFIGPQGLYTGRANEKLGEIHASKGKTAIFYWL
jgi:hypothetical protein